MERYIINVKLLMCAVLVLMSSNSGQATDYMEDACDTTIYITDGTRLESQMYQTYCNDFECNVILSATNVNQRLILQFDYIQLERFDSTSCVDYIRMYDGDNIYATALLTACTTSFVDGWYWLSTYNKVLLRWVTDESIVNSGFSMTISVYQEIDAGFPCDGTGQFNCSNDRCISDTLYCNGINDCTDYSDETRDDGSVCTVVGPHTNKPVERDDPCAGTILASTTTTITMGLIVTIVMHVIG